MNIKKIHDQDLKLPVEDNYVSRFLLPVSQDFESNGDVSIATVMFICFSSSGV